MDNKTESQSTSRVGRKPTKKQGRARHRNRSIRFPIRLLEYLQAKAKKTRRSVNWLVNESVARDLGIKWG